jgi:hypothetical protein
MNGFELLLVAVGCGGLAWGMLVVSDWLLRDKEERAPKSSSSSPVRDKTRENRDVYFTRWSHRQMG